MKILEKDFWNYFYQELFSHLVQIPKSFFKTIIPPNNKYEDT